MRTPSKRLRNTWWVFTLLVACCGFPQAVRADVGLIVETPTGLLGFLSDVGHVSVWISHGCIDRSGRIDYCERSDGLVLTSTAYWPNPGAAAIPAELFFLGAEPGTAGRDEPAWTRALGEAYPEVKPEVGAKYMGRAWLRSLRVLRFPTSEEQDRRVLAQINQSQRDYQYSYSKRNCAYYAQTILQRYFGENFHANRVLELGIDTPRALERALQHRLKQQGIPSQTVYFKGRLRHAWRQPPRNICESAIFDPKYAIPLLMYQPYLYAGFAGCYGAIRVTAMVKGHDPAMGQVPPMGFTAALPRQPQLHSYELLTGQSPRDFLSANTDRADAAQTSRPTMAGEP